MNCLLALVFVHTSTFLAPNDPRYQFDPARAFDQKVITSRSLQEELGQFRALRQFQVTRAQLKTVQYQFLQMKKELERAQQLRASGAMSENKFSEVYYSYRKIETEVIRLPTALAQDRLVAEFHRLRLLEEGNPDLDNRRQLLRVIIDGIRAEEKNLEGALQLARCGVELADRFVAKGQDLIKRNTISELELEKRELTAKSAAVQLESVQNQLDLARNVLNSFSKSEDALAKE